MASGRTTSAVPSPTPGDSGSLETKQATYDRLIRFVDTDYVQAAAKPIDEKEPSFNPLQRSHRKGGRFDAARRDPGDWLYDPYEYLYGAIRFKGAFYEIFGTRVENANGLGIPPELDATKWVEVFRACDPLTTVDLRERWEGKSIPHLINTTPDYPACREWASWIRIKDETVQAIEYQPPHALPHFCVVFFRDHGSATKTRGSCRGCLRVFRALRITERLVQGWIRGSGVGNASFVVS
jgi:hypothetical protein